MAAAPEFIFFDAVGTLLHLPKGPAWHYAEVAGRHGLRLDPAQTARAFGRAYRAQPAQAATQRPREDEDRGWWGQIVQAVLEECGAPAHFPREAYFAELYDEFRTAAPWALFPETRRVLERLHGRVRLGIISNFDARLREVLRHLKIAHFFEVVILSSEVGADKPHPYIFERALAAAGVPAAQALLIGDDETKDLAGASAVGMQCQLVQRPEVTLEQLELP